MPRKMKARPMVVRPMPICVFVLISIMATNLDILLAI